MKLYYCVDHSYNDEEFYVLDTGFGVMEMISDNSIEIASSIEYLIQFWEKHNCDVTVVRVL